MEENGRRREARAMRQEGVTIRSYAKVNLCLDVGEVMEGGYHEVNMILQQILLHDDVLVRWRPQAEAEAGGGSREGSCPADGCGPGSADHRAEASAEEAEGSLTKDRSDGIHISVHTNRPYLPTDRRNLAWQAADLMIRRFGGDRRGEIRIDMRKRIPVAAGLAGGSSNCGAVIHAVNHLWGLGLSLKELCQLGGELGSDVPFCIMGQAAADPTLRPAFGEDPLACHCAVATGRGTDLRGIRGLRSHLVLSKPPISVSTAQAYRGVDEVQVTCRPDVEAMVRALAARDMEEIEKNMVNVLENFTLRQYPIVVYTKDKMQDMCKPQRVLMSGSGPTVFGLTDSREEAQRICERMREMNRESFWTRTTW